MDAFYRLQTDANVKSNQLIFKFFLLHLSPPIALAEDQDIWLIFPFEEIPRTGCNICVCVSLYANTNNNRRRFSFSSIIDIRSKMTHNSAQQKENMCVPEDLLACSISLNSD